jgi:hypothetical protein
VPNGSGGSTANGSSGSAAGGSGDGKTAGPTPTTPQGKEAPQ